MFTIAPWSPKVFKEQIMLCGSKFKVAPSTPAAGPRKEPSCEIISPPRPLYLPSVKLIMG